MKPWPLKGTQGLGVNRTSLSTINLAQKPYTSLSQWQPCCPRGWSCWGCTWGLYPNPVYTFSLLILFYQLAPFTQAGSLLLRPPLLDFCQVFVFLIMEVKHDYNPSIKIFEH